MKKTALLWLIALAGVLILAVLLVRPPAWATPMPAVQDAVPWRTAVSTGDVSLQIVDSPASEVMAGAEQMAQQVADTPSSDNCIACHTDKKKLKKLAKEPEEVKSEKASGEG